MSLTPPLTDHDALDTYRAETRRLRAGIGTVIRRLETSRTQRHCQTIVDLQALLDGEPQEAF
jgi:hypothetical protein